MITKIRNIGVIITGNTPKTSDAKNYDSCDIPFVKPSDLSDDEITSINFTEFYISEYARDKARVVPPNSVFMTCIGIIGKVGINQRECAFNQQINVVVPDANKCLPEYLAYALINKRTYLQAIANAPVVPIINKTQFGDMEIDIPILEEQKEVVDVLRKVDGIIHGRKQQLSKLDELVKSRFIEMFGDPIINSKNLPEKIFIDVVMLQRGFDLPTQNRVSSGDVPVYGSNGVLDFHDKSRCSNGVITGRSGTIGKVYYCKNDYWPLNTTLFSVDTKGNNIVYLAYLLNYYNLARFYDGTGVPTLNRNVVHKQKIIDVPLDLQNQFATFVEQTDKLKSEIKESLEKLETLKKSLMQKYFG